MVELVYRKSGNPEVIAKKVIVTGFGSDGVPVGQVIDDHGISVVVRALGTKERRKFAAREPGQEVIEMGESKPYKSINDEARLRGLIRPYAPSSRSGRGRPIFFSPTNDRRPGIHGWRISVI